MYQDSYNRYMAIALHEAEIAFEENEVPVGAIIVYDGRIIGRGHNQIEQLKDATAHAEMIALSAAYNSIGDWRLDDCTLICTLEPCAMCAGAMSLSRIGCIVYGAHDPKFGACGSILDIPSEQRLNHQIEVVSGIMAEEVATLMKEFFVKLRKGRERIH